MLKLSKYQLLIIIFMLSNCTIINQHNYKKKPINYQDLSADDFGNHRYLGHYKLGKSYQIKNKRYVPRLVQRYSKNGIASWYGERHNFHGQKTANGDIFNKEMLTAAHKTLPLPSLVLVTNHLNKRSIIVLINDRGPFAYDREIDLSEKAAEKLDIKKRGIAPVNVRYLHKETQEFLKILGLKPELNSLAKRPLQNKYCTVNCHIKLINAKYRLPH